MESVILTSYFSRKKHPQAGDGHVIGCQEDGHVKRSDFSYIEKWYNSITKLNINARIFYDELSEEFLNEYSTDKIKFIKTDVESTRYSNNDWRFFCYKKYLDNNKHDVVFMTDCSDVVVVKDPSNLISECKDYNFFAGRDTIKWGNYDFAGLSYAETHRKSQWLEPEFFIKNLNLPLINMGVVGGEYDKVVLFLRLFKQAREGSPLKLNINMATGNFVLRHLLEKEYNICVGAPVTSDYKSYQNDRTDVYFIHK